MLKRNSDFKYKAIEVPISCYTTTYNCVKEDFPFEIAIKSFLQFSNECVVVDGFSTDGTFEKLQQMSEQDPRIKVYQNEFDLTEPGIDGNQKAFARCLCENEILVQFDVDELAHEIDIEKWKLLAKKFPKDTDILHLPVVELWGDLEHSTYRRHMWKWRISRNKPEITHAINKHARLTDETTGKVYARKGMSDGCEYANVMTYDPKSEHTLAHEFNHTLQYVRFRPAQEYMPAEIGFLKDKAHLRIGEDTASLLFNIPIAVCTLTEETSCGRRWWNPTEVESYAMETANTIGLKSKSKTPPLFRENAGLEEQLTGNNYLPYINYIKPFEIKIEPGDYKIDPDFKDNKDENDDKGNKDKNKPLKLIVGPF